MDWNPASINWDAAAAIATTVAVVVALWEALSARQDAAIRDIRRQAELVSCWYDGGGVMVLNASSNAIHHVIAWVVFAQGAGPSMGEEVAGGDLETPGLVLVVPPGRLAVPVEHEPMAGMFSKAGAEIAFTDTAGRHWIRRVSGRLERLNKDPVAHYHLNEPLEWSDVPDFAVY